jgi:ribosomal protein L11 methylase PrmA
VINIFFNFSAIFARFSKLVKLGEQLVLSGILHEQLEIILDAYGEYFSELKVVQKEDWSRVNGKSLTIKAGIHIFTITMFRI